jgi:hypothetical protein
MSQFIVIAVAPARRQAGLAMALNVTAAAGVFASGAPPGAQVR